MDEAFREFSHMSVHNVVSWTAIISGFVQDNDIFSSLKLFKDMRQIGQEINSYTLTSVLSACAKPGMIDLAVQIHSLILKLGFYLYLNVGAALINMYAKMGEVELSELAFNEMENKKDQGTWAAILSSFAQWSGFVTEASVGCSLFTIYSKCGNLEESYKVFLQVPVKDNVSWTSMISGLAEHGYAEQALQLFRDMIIKKFSPIMWS
ncbi:pentatricopeptide repeat-containing protein At1g74600, chloroplastic-like [Arachis stenosperma]|uniref:pentatricopeptide repeat-containing protein At1g74600, chloroplastic-like n=1 Tax=Arachis stenosperma TaxID=217475 RepID=UPI0025AD0E29|nr:pentatricopeptide repeat-containing protein At1g74600, chloroplastic-like [Arachis stenosperma]